MTRSGSSAPDCASRPQNRPHGWPTFTSRSCLLRARPCFQNDRKIAQIASEAFDGERLDAVITTVEIDPASRAPANVRIERFVAHSPVLDGAACFVCHAGMGIIQKALAHGVPVVAVPFGRDQPEVARRVEVARAGVRLPALQARPCSPPNDRPRRDQPPTGSSAHRRRIRSSRGREPPPTRSRHSHAPPPTPAPIEARGRTNTNARCSPLTRATRRPVPRRRTAIRRRSRLRSSSPSGSVRYPDAPPGAPPYGRSCAPRNPRPLEHG